MNCFNLLRERWIPVRLQSGAMALIAPHELVSLQGQDFAIDVASPRPDFNGALLQFLIGLVQTAFPPDDKRSWRRFLATPPDPSVLQERFAQFTFAFNLDGDGPRFMQDIEVSLDTLNDPVPINRLIINEPGEQSEKLNKDFFVKRGSSPFLSLPAAALALLTLQLNAPSGGQGHRTSLRGGGPLTSVLEGDSLWETVWRNVLQSQELNYSSDSVDRSKELIFPWLTQTRTSENDEKIEPADAHPLLMFWACSRRIRLLFSSDKRACNIFTALAPDRGCEHYVTKNYGANYSENWIHPLTPYRGTTEGLLFTVKAPQAGISVRNWLGLVAQAQGAQPALVVRRQQAENQQGASRLLCFGYAMDNAKPRNWVQSQLPLYLFPDESSVERYAKDMFGLVSAAEEARDILKKALKIALGKKSHMASYAQQLNNSLEGEFFALAGVLSESDESSRIACKTKWLQVVVATTRNTFDQLLLGGDLVGVDSPRVFAGRAFLQKLFKQRWSKLEGMLELPLSAPVLLERAKKKTRHVEQEAKV